jgi:peptide/nickel transport system ATP-binding protein
MKINMINISNITKNYKQGGLIFGVNIQALKNINLSIDTDNPSILSIVGESGSGKTTLSKLILRLTKPDSGTIKILDKNIRDSKYSNRNVFNRLIQPIFQNPFESFSSKKYVHKYFFNVANNYSHNDAEAMYKINKYLELVGLDLQYVMNKMTKEFSGGELQRISIARALIAEPKFIIADEPVSMIDASLRMNIINLFLKIKNDLKIYFIYITHDLSTAYYISDFVAIMQKGEIIEFGKKNILDTPKHDYTKLLLDSVPNIQSKWD